MNLPGRLTLQASLVGAVVFMIYALGACRTIYVGDSGELVAAAATLGIPHPSGYPLYVLLGKLWITILPLASVAFRMSLFSAFFGALACGLLYVVVRRQGLSAVSALVGALCLAFAPSFWSQATVQRVYTLNGFFVVAVVACALEWHRTRRIGWMVLAAFVAGLGASNHTAMAVVGVTIGLFAWMTEPALLRRPRQLAACIAAGLAGLLPYVYLPWRSSQDPRLDWGNPETLDGWMGVMTRRDFWHRAWIEAPSDLLEILGDYLWALGSEMLWVGAALAVVGIVHGLFRLPVLLPTLIMVTNLMVMALHGSRSDLFIWHRYYIPSFAMVALLAAWGTEFFVLRWPRRSLAILALPLLMLSIGWPRFDRSEFTIADDFSRQLLDTLPPGAHLAASDDNILFVLIYLQLVEGLRPDVNLIMQGVGGADLGSLRFDPDEDPLFFTHHPNWAIEGLEVLPVGLVFRTVRSGAPPPELALPAGGLAGALDPRVPKDYLAQNLVGHYYYMLGITHENRDWPRAQEELERAMRAAPDNDVLYYNLGLIYARNGLAQRALSAFEHAAAINPRPIPSAHPVRAAERVLELTAEIERLEVIEEDLLRGATFAEDSEAARYRTMAELLAARGERLAARGLRLLAEELESRRLRSIHPS